MATFALPTSEHDREKIMKLIVEISNSYTRIAAEKDMIKETVAAISEEYELPKKFVNKFAKTYWQQNFNDVLGEQQDFEDFVAALVPEAVE